MRIRSLVPSFEVLWLHVRTFAFMSESFKPRGRDGWDPHYDVLLLRVMRDNGWVSVQVLAEEVVLRTHGYIELPKARLEGWLATAERRRLVEQHPDRPNEWGTTSRGETRLRTVKASGIVSLIGLAIAVAALLATTLGTDRSFVLVLVVAAVVVVLLVFVYLAQFGRQWEFQNAWMAFMLEPDEHGHIRYTQIPSAPSESVDRRRKLEQKEAPASADSGAK